MEHRNGCLERGIRTCPTAKLRIQVPGAAMAEREGDLDSPEVRVEWSTPSAGLPPPIPNQHSDSPLILRAEEPTDLGHRQPWMPVLKGTKMSFHR